ncbi:MAG: ORF6N domain-containing protein [Ginsengibacter sp.]
MQLQVIQQKIFELRDQKVMLDFDLAELYDVETKVLNQSVKRNFDRFPKDFMFRLTEKEWGNIKSQIVMAYNQVNEIQRSNSSQIVTSSRKHRGAKYLPYAFTEHGITMLASVLRSDTAIKMNIAIVRAFIALRKFAVQYNELLEQIKELHYKVGNHDAQLNSIYEAIENLLDDKADKQAEQQRWKTRERIGFKK